MKVELSKRQVKEIVRALAFTESFQMHSAAMTKCERRKFHRRTAGKLKAIRTMLEAAK